MPACCIHQLNRSIGTVIGSYADTIQWGTDEVFKTGES